MFKYQEDDKVTIWLRGIGGISIPYDIWLLMANKILEFKDNVSDSE